MKKVIVIMYSVALVLLTNCMDDFAHAASSGFLYDGTTWTALDYPGSNGTIAYGIDGSNIVGRYFDTDNNIHGFFYDGTTWTTLDYPNSGNTRPYDIDGNNIVGWWSGSSNPNPIPIPGAVWLLGSGLIGIVGIRRKFKK